MVGSLNTISPDYETITETIKVELWDAKIKNMGYYPVKDNSRIVFAKLPLLSPDSYFFLGVYSVKIKSEVIKNGLTIRTREYNRVSDIYPCSKKGECPCT
jgi:hypothetical protein